MANPRERPWGKKDTKKILVRNLRKWDYWQFSTEVDFTKIWSENDEIWSADKNKKNSESGRNPRFEPLWDNTEKGSEWISKVHIECCAIRKIMFLVLEKNIFDVKNSNFPRLSKCSYYKNFNSSCLGTMFVLPNIPMSHILENTNNAKNSNFPHFKEVFMLPKIRISHIFANHQ